jgi:Na+/proline symporter
MFFALSLLDYGLLAFYLLVLIGIGWYFRREQHNSRDFFLAGRSMRGFPIGLSMTATCVSAWGYTGVPGEAYFVGCKLLIIPLAFWCCLPLLTHTVLPLYYRLGIGSVYEYLELRYDARTRLVSSTLFVLWRLLWLGGVLYAPCRVLLEGAGLQIDAYWLLMILGIATTLYTFLGGMRTVIWTSVIQAAVMAAGLILVVVVIWMRLDGGPYRVAEVSRTLGRAEVLDVSWNLANKWTFWGIFPYFFLAILSSFVADQLTAQRYLSARNLTQAKWSITWNCVLVTIMIPALLYAGLALLAFYHDYPEAMRPMWVANVDHQTRQSACDARGAPLIAWSPQAITPENIRQLVADRRLLRPNTQEPFADADDLIISDGGAEHVNIRRLAMRRPPPDGLKQGEIILNERAQDELLPNFITSQLARGVAGWLFLAVFAASMCSIGAGIQSICTLLIIDFHRRLGIGRHFLARRLDKPVGQLSEADELRIGRPLVLIIGVTVTLLSLGMARMDDAFTMVVHALSTLAGPLLAVFLLGMFTRRTTAVSALTTLFAGVVFTSSLVAANHSEALACLWPWQQKLNGIWPLTCSVVFSLAWGYLMSFVLGRRKTSEELRGLVVGLGTLGIREPEEASIAIPDSFDSVEESERGR